MGQVIKPVANIFTNQSTQIYYYLTSQLEKDIPESIVQLQYSLH